MAASPVHQLRDLLQEQQEPFVLEVYLLEKGYLKRRTKLKQSSFSCCHWNSRKLINRSGRCRLYKSKMGIPLCLKVLRAAYNQLISFRERPKTEETNHRDGTFFITQKARNGQEEFNSSSSTSSKTMCNLSSKGDVEKTINSLQQDVISLAANFSQPFVLRNQKEKEVTSNRKLQFRCIEDGKQLSPVSVLEEIHSCGSSPLETGKTEDLGPTTKVGDNSIFCGSAWELLFQSGIRTSIRAEVTEIQELVHSSSHYSQPRMSKTELQQRRQLLFDCVREVVETQTRNAKEQELPKEYLQSEELGKLVGQKIISWSKQFEDETNSIILADSNFVDSAQEWSSYEQQKREIALEIGDAILEEIITVIVRDMTGLLSSTTKCL